VQKTVDGKGPLTAFFSPDCTSINHLITFSKGEPRILDRPCCASLSRQSMIAIQFTFKCVTLVVTHPFPHSQHLPSNNPRYTVLYDTVFFTNILSVVAIRPRARLTTVNPCSMYLLYMYCHRISDCSSPFLSTKGVNQPASANNKAQKGTCGRRGGGDIGSPVCFID